MAKIPTLRARAKENHLLNHGGSSQRHFPRGRPASEPEESDKVLPFQNPYPGKSVHGSVHAISTELKGPITKYKLLYWKSSINCKDHEKSI